MGIQQHEMQAARRRASRQDGEGTRRLILETAGELFAERGYADTTSKDICSAANVNGAAVNYYFGGKEGLYREVLIEAHQQLLNRDDLEEVDALKVAPGEKLRVFYKRLLFGQESTAKRWGAKIFLREISAPSMAVEAVLPVAVLPKAEILRRIISEIIGEPADSPTVQRGTAFVVLPCICLIMFPERLRTKILPAVNVNDESMLDDMVRYTIAGLNALRDK